MSVWQSKAVVAAGLAVVAMLSGCATSAPVGPSASGDSTSASSSAAAPTSQAPAGGGDPACAAWEGKSGVIRVFCTGPATATISVDGKEKSLSGGECETLGTTLAFNLGVVTSDFPEDVTKPDYVGILLDTSGTNPTSVAFTIGGTADVVTSAKASLGADKKSGTITGTSMMEDAKVSLSFNCG